MSEDSIGFIAGNSESTFCRKCLNSLIGRLCLSIVCVVSLFVNSALVFYLLNKPSNHLPGDRHYPQSPQSLKLHEQLNEAVCVTCHILGNPNLQNRQLTVFKVKDQQLCCLAQETGVLSFLQLYITKSMVNPGHNERIPGAQLYLDTLTDNNYKWTDAYGYGAGFISPPSTRLSQGRLTVNQEGLYNVYSFLTLKRRHTSTLSQTNIGHSIMKMGNQIYSSIERILQRIVYLPSRNESFSTSYLSGIVRLEAGDQLYVDVSHLELVYRYAPANFFGLFMVDNMETD